MFPHRHRPTLALRHRQAMMDGFNRHYRLFPHRDQPAPSTASSGRLARPAARAARAHRVLRPARQRMPMRLEREFKADQQPMDVWHQVKLHYIGLLVTTTSPSWPRPSSTRSPRASCTAATSTTTSSSCGRPSAPSTSENDDPQRRPTYRAYYPGDARGTHAGARHVAGPSAARAAPTWRATPTVVLTPCSARAGGDKARPTSRSRCCQPVLPQQGRLPGRQDHQRLSTNPVRACPSCTARRALVHRRPLFGEDDLLMLFSFSRLLHGDMEIPAPTCSSCAA